MSPPQPPRHGLRYNGWPFYRFARFHCAKFSYARGFTALNSQTHTRVASWRKCSAQTCRLPPRHRRQGTEKNSPGWCRARETVARTCVAANSCCVARPSLRRGESSQPNHRDSPHPPPPTQGGPPHPPSPAGGGGVWGALRGGGGGGGTMPPRPPIHGGISTHPLIPMEGFLPPTEASSHPS